MDNDFIGIYDNGEQWPNQVIYAVTWFNNNINVFKHCIDGLAVDRRSLSRAIAYIQQC